MLRSVRLRCAAPPYQGARRRFGLPGRLLRLPFDVLPWRKLQEHRQEAKGMPDSGPYRVLVWVKAPEAEMPGHVSGRARGLRGGNYWTGWALVGCGACGAGTGLLRWLPGSCRTPTRIQPTRAGQPAPNPPVHGEARLPSVAALCWNRVPSQHHHQIKQ